MRVDYAYLDYICWNEVDKAIVNIRYDAPVYGACALDQLIVMCLSIIRELVCPSGNKITLDVSFSAQLLQVIMPYVAVDDKVGLESVARIGFFLSQIEAQV